MFHWRENPDALHKQARESLRPPAAPSGVAPHLVEWLSDNGSAYIAKDTLDRLRPPASPAMVRDLMIVCVERRFWTSKANGELLHVLFAIDACDREVIARSTATALGLQLSFTPVRSPESNGIAEPPSKRRSILPDAAIVIALLGSRVTMKFTRTLA